MKFVLVVTIALLSAVATSASAQSLNVIQQKLARSLPADLGQLYVEAETALQNKNVSGAGEKFDALLERARVLKDRLGIGTGLVGQGIVYGNLQNYSSAFDSLNAALPYLADPNASAIEGWAYAALGEASLQLNDFRQAISAFEKALSIAHDLLAKATDEELRVILSVRGEVLQRKANAHEQLGEFDEAVKNSVLAADDLEKIGNKPLVALALWRAGDLLSFKLRKLRDAIAPLSKATALFEELGDIDSAASTRVALGRAYYYSNERQQAEVAFVGALNLAQKGLSDDVSLEAKYGLARITEDRSDYRQALVRYREVIDALRKSSSKSKGVSEADVLFRVGELYRLLSDYESAIEQLLSAVVKFREEGNKRGEADSLAKVADIFLWVGEGRSASVYYKRSLSIFRTENNSVQQIRILTSLIEAAARTEGGSFAEAKQYVIESQKLLEMLQRSVKNELDLLMPKLNELTNAAPDQQDIELARRDYAWRFNTKIDPSTDQGPYLYSAALLGSKLRNAPEAAKLWEKTIPSLGVDYRRAIGSLAQTWGVLLLSGGDLENGVPALFLSNQYFLTLPLNRDTFIDLAKNFFYMGVGYRQQKLFQLALTYFELAFYLAQSLRTPEIHWIHAAMGQTLLEMGDYETALIEYRKGLVLLESVQTGRANEEIKIGLFSSSTYIYRDFIALLLSLYEKNRETKYLDEAFEYTQRGKARGFLERLQQANVSRRSSISETHTSDNAKIDQEIANIHGKLRDANLFTEEGKQLLIRLDVLRGQQAQLEQKTLESMSSGGQKALLRTAKISEIQAMLPVDSVLFEYIESNRAGITLWAITKDQARQFTISLQNYSAISQYLQTLRVPLFGAAELNQHIDLGERVYRMLIEPAQELLQGKRRLIVSADGNLHFLPFETLIVPTKTARTQIKSAAGIAYLIKDVSITYVPSASAYVTQQEQTKSLIKTVKFPLLAFGDPVYAGEFPKNDKSPQVDEVLKTPRRAILQRLEYSGDEIQRVARIWGVALNSEHVNLRGKATVETLRNINLSQYGVIHFAAHAILQDDLNFLSQPALVLTDKDATPTRGLLRFADILALKQNADLVILSACDTGLGQLKGGEGIIGLTRAFLYGGASSAVVSLWKVEDQSTALLMQKFHERLKSGQSKDEALRQAKLDIMKTQIQLKATGNQESLAAPFFWAPFILVGDAGPLRLN